VCMKKKTLSYFNSTYQAFKKKRPVKTKNFPKLGDSVLPQSSCKAPNPAQALLRVRTQGLKAVGPWGPWNESHGARGGYQLRPVLSGPVLAPEQPTVASHSDQNSSIVKKVSVCNCSGKSILYSCRWYCSQALVRFGLAV